MASPDCCLSDDKQGATGLSQDRTSSYLCFCSIDKCSLSAGVLSLMYPVAPCFTIELLVDIQHSPISMPFGLGSSPGCGRELAYIGVGDEPDYVKRLYERIRGFDVLRVSEILERKVAEGEKRKYFRFRFSRFYGGSAVGDVVGCNLRCAFCWTGRPRDDVSLGFWVTARQAAKRLAKLAGKSGLARLSAGEPTLGWRHLVSLLDFIAEYYPWLGFILETNGVLIGARPSYARLLAEHPVRPLVRVSIKACSGIWFRVLTGAREDALELQIKAIEALYDSNAKFRVAVFAAFGSKKCWANLLGIIAERTGPEVLRDMEVEPLVLYPTAKRRLKLLGVKPTNPELVYEP